MAGQRIKICKEAGCKNAQTTKGYCRLHYLKNWKELKSEAQKKAAKRLNNYIEGICRKNPDGYVDSIRKDIRSDFQKEGARQEPAGADEFEDAAHGLGFDEDSLDRLVHNIKIDKDF